MAIIKLNRREQEKLIVGAKKGDKVKIEIIVGNFQGLVRNIYNRRIHNKVNISLDDFEQECNMKIIKCINEVTEENYCQLSSLIEISLEHKASNFIRDNLKYSMRQIPVENIISVCDRYNLSPEHKFDELIVSDMIADESYNTLIKNRLSKEEDKAFSSYIFGESLEDYAKERGVKKESVKRYIRNAVNKLVNKEQIKKFHCIAMISFIFLQNIWDYIDCMNIEVFIL